MILDGDGADELFGGYRRYVPFSKYDFFKSNAIIRNSARLLTSMLMPSNNKKSRSNYFYRLLSLASKDDLAIYLAAGVDIMEGFEFNIINKGIDYLQPIRNDFSEIANADISGLRKIMNMDFNTTLFSDLLIKMDMANSLEGRSPFLCKELLEYTPGMKDEFKINGTTAKYLLRLLAKKYLPPALINQPKRGFEITLKNLVENQLKYMIFDSVNATNSISRQLLNKDFLEALLMNNIKISAEKRAKILWTLLNMEIWYKNSV